VNCPLCTLFDSSQHPSHPEAPRCGDKDYESLAKRQARVRSKRAVRLKEWGTGCVRKFKFPNPAAARKEARRLGNPSIHEYHCRDCGGFHIGKGERAGA
jgi:hypothetical protein